MQKCNFFTDLQIPDSCHQKLVTFQKRLNENEANDTLTV